MRIKLAILERDTSYLNRIVSVFSTKYAENFEMYAFTDQEVALSTLDEAKIDVLLVDDVFEIDTEAIPRRCALAYLVESSDVETMHEQRAIFKYQKVELIYKQILSLYAEKAGSVSGLRMDGTSCRIISFVSAGGGVGSSCMAAACALNIAARGSRVLYLNLEKFGSSDSFFSAEGQFDMSDVTFSIKSKKANLAIKLESYVRRDARGVFFFAPSKIALDMMELGANEIVGLLTELQMIGSYDYIVVDGDFSLDAGALKVYQKCNALVMVGDGSEISNLKTQRAFAALSTLERDSDAPVANRMKLLYNRFSNKTSKTIDLGIKNIGGAPRYEHASAAEVVRQLATLNVFDQIL